MKSKRVHPVNPERLAELRRHEQQASRNPTAEILLKLADEYHALGLGKESDRLMQQAEEIENGGNPLGRRASNGLLSGAANAIMITEVIQILTRTNRSGDLTIDTDAQSFHLYFDQGQIINASSKCHQDGLASFRMSLRVTDGEYRFVEKSVDNVSRLLIEPTEILLLNAVHEEDQEAHARFA